MRFAKKETAQDVVVCCCILHNMRKNYDYVLRDDYTREEYQLQRDIGAELLSQPPQRIQNFLVNHYFDQ